MNKMLKVMGGIALGSMACIVGYTMLNKKTRRKAEDLADTMLNEAKSMMK
jgi:hypothetical protein